MISASLNARVYCKDGPGGFVTGVMVDTILGRATHFIVRVKSAPAGNQVLVPLDGVLEASSRKVYLSYTKSEFSDLETFVKREIAEPEFHTRRTSKLETSNESIPVAQDSIAPKDMRISPLETAILRGATVEAQDGFVGEVGEFLIEHNNGKITHLVLMSGHLWGKKAVALPVSAVQRIEHNRIYLKISKQAISTLPAIPVRRTWNEVSVEDVELLIALFADESAARQVIKEIRRLERYDDLDILNAALVNKGGDGKTKVYETGDVYPRRGALFGALAGGVFGLFGGPAGMVFGAIAGALTGHTMAGKIDMGFSDSYLEGLLESLKPGKSAIIALVENKWVTTIIEIFSQYHAEVFQHTIPDEEVATILAQNEQSPAENRK